MLDKRNLQASGKTMQFPWAGAVRQRQNEAAKAPSRLEHLRPVTALPMKSAACD
jgi:hypothetical protein